MKIKFRKHAKNKSRMKFNYDAESDIMLIQLNKSRKIDFAKQADGIIVHFSKKYKPVLLEIMDASKFLAQGLETTSQSFQQLAKCK